MMFGYVNDHMSAWGWFGMSVGMLAFWALLIAVIVLVVRWVGGSTHASTSSPEQILADRFARGEIDEAEYRDRLAALHPAPHLERR